MGLILPTIYVSPESVNNIKDLNQCVTVEFSMTRPRVVNVLIYLDSARAYSNKQTSKLRLLTNKLRHPEGPDTSFFVVLKNNSALNPKITINSNAINETLAMLQHNVPLTVIEDNMSIKNLTKFNNVRKQMLIIDNYGKLRHLCILYMGPSHPIRIPRPILYPDQISCLHDKPYMYVDSDSEDDDVN